MEYLPVLFWLYNHRDNLNQAANVVNAVSTLSKWTYRAGKWTYQATQQLSTVDQDNPALRQVEVNDAILISYETQERGNTANLDELISQEILAQHAIEEVINPPSPQTTIYEPTAWAGQIIEEYF